jgi:hypothetical protein
MELLRKKNREVSSLVTIKENVILAYLDYNMISTQKQLTGNASIIQKNVHV